MINHSIYNIYQGLFQRPELHLKSKSITAALHFMEGIKLAMETTAREHSLHLEWQHGAYPGFEFDRFLCEKLEVHHLHDACARLLEQSDSEAQALEKLMAHFQAFQKQNQPNSRPSLISKLAGHYPKASISPVGDDMIELVFQKAKEPVIIQLQEEEGRYTISYLRLVVDPRRNIRKEESITSQNILWEGLCWVLNQMQKHGRALPEF